MAYHQYHSGLSAGFDHPLSIGQGIGYGLFHKYMLPVPGSQFGLLCVNRVGGDEEDASDIIPVQKVFVAFLLIASELLAER